MIRESYAIYMKWPENDCSKEVFNSSLVVLTMNPSERKWESIARWVIIAVILCDPSWLWPFCIDGETDSWGGGQSIRSLVAVSTSFDTRTHVIQPVLEERVWMGCTGVPWLLIPLEESVLLPFQAGNTFFPTKSIWGGRNRRTFLLLRCLSWSVWIRSLCHAELVFAKAKVAPLKKDPPHDGTYGRFLGA